MIERSLHRPELTAAVAEAMELLIDLQERSTQPDEARRLCRALARRHQGVEMLLVAEREPSTQSCYFELFVGSEQHGGVVLGYGPNRAVPFMLRGSVRLGDDLLRVNGVPLSLPGAIQLLDVTHDQDLGDQLLTALIVRQAIDDAADEPIDDAELQRALDDFRSVRGLFDAAAMRRWMAVRGLDEDVLARMIADQVHGERLRARVTDDAVVTCFAERRADFDVALAGIVELRSFDEARAFVQAAEVQPFHALVEAQAIAGVARYRVERWRRWRCPPELRPALFDGDRDELHALRLGDRFVVVRSIGLLICHGLDDETRRVVRDRLFDDWLDAQKQSALVEWNGNFNLGNRLGEQR